MLPKKLTLDVHAPTITGTGGHLCLEVKAAQKTKAGNIHRTALVLSVDRFFITALCRAIAEMQTNDRERIRLEMLRLSTEVSALVNK